MIQDQLGTTITLGSKVAFVRRKRICTGTVVKLIASMHARSPYNANAGHDFRYRVHVALSTNLGKRAYFNANQVIAAKSLAA